MPVSVSSGSPEAHLASHPGQCLKVDYMSWVLLKVFGGGGVTCMESNRCL